MHHNRHRVPHILASLEGYVEWSHKVFLFGCYGNFDRVSELRLPVSPTSERRKSLVVEGSDYGILCLSRFGEDPSALYLCNPATKQVKALPSLPIFSSNKKHQFGFGCDPLTNDFKRSKRMPRTLESYHSSISDVKQHTSRLSCSLVLNGSVHWMLHFGSSRRWPRDLLTGIVAFDLNTEAVFRLIETPVKGIVHAMAKLSECLSLIACDNMSNFINIWVMKEYGDSNYLIKQVAIDTTEHELISSCPQPLCFASNGFMLLVGVDGFYLYVPNSNTVEDVFKSENERVGIHSSC
ncbi:F-box associated domain [Parasponia andersonii]|uniref:F-box associated domain n=1 Tax=Parasponia andersonii TaxID=3476 RepID=A0A2P5DF66_PARAD|nr:F-box associated domain [Parasponia andersonii]